jgi:hypothetical protein
VYRVFEIQRLQFESGLLFYSIYRIVIIQQWNKEMWSHINFLFYFIFYYFNDNFDDNFSKKKKLFAFYL